MLDKVKLALRINHDLLDDDINDTISTARAELIRSGVSADVANSNLDIVQMAIKTYCLYVYASTDKLKDGNIKEILVDQYGKIKEKNANGEETNVESEGLVVVLEIVNALSDVNQEKLIYDLLGGILGKKTKEIAEQDLQTTVSDLKAIAEQNDLQSFFNLAYQLTK